MEAAPGLRVLFLLRAINLDRVFENALRELLRRGHVVHVVLEREKRGLPAGAGAVFGALRAEFGGFSFEQLPERAPTPVEVLATEARLALDYLRYLEPEFDRAPALRERARRNAPKRFVRLVERRAVAGPARRALARALASLERRLPVPRETLALVGGHAPDVVLVSPLVELGSAQVDVVRAAAELGVPTVLLVASWDNLTNKGRIKEVPSLTVVWNEAQADEATLLHAIPRARVAVVGAHTFDHWFGWTPGRDADAFADAVGLDRGRAFLLYTCSSTFVAREEADFVAEWVARLRAHPDARLQEVGVVVRPHPQGVTRWEGFAGREPGRTVVWPPVGETPGDAARKRDYFDSIHHAAAVVGINTSAFVEAAIVGTPTFALLDDRFRATQEGTLHFAHLRDVLSLARSWDEHLAQLSALLAEPAARREALDRFVRSFVRPAGVERPASPLLADAVERAAAAPVRRRRRSRAAEAVWRLSALAAKRA